MRAFAQPNEICAEMRAAEGQLHVLQRLAALCNLKGSETFYILFLDIAQSLLEVPAGVFRCCLGGSVRDSLVVSHRGEYL